MDFMKVLDQTVREIKREVNLKVLKVPEIEQKVLDATSDEPWGPHGSALSELAQATLKFSECQMIMNVLWTRLTDTGANWRHVYKALTVIEYLIANGSERALDDILERSFRISSLSGFEYVEPNGKDVGINVRKKVETIVALIHDKEKIQAVRNKAAATRDKYFGLSSTGVTFKSSASSFGSSDRYGGFGSSRDGESFKDSYKDDHKSNDDRSTENESGLKKGSSGRTGSRNSSSSNSSKTAKMPAPVLSSKSPSMEQNTTEDDFDDFDPRGTSKGANTTSNQVDLFGESLVDLMDAPTSTPSEPAFFSNTNTPEVDLFADATFVSASPHSEATPGSHDQDNVDLFASQPAFPPPPAANVANVDLFGASEVKYSTSEPEHSTTFDPFAVPDSSKHADTKSSASEATNTKAFDPFAAIPLNNFEESDSFGTFTSHTQSVTTEPQQNATKNSLRSLEQTSSMASKPAPMKNAFQVKSGVWADSLSRGLIDLNITAPKKANLAGIGIVGGLGDTSNNGKGTATPWYMADTTVGLGSGIPPSNPSMGGTSFSTSGQQQYGSFK
ncbi:clathrin interactor EPSIN 1-like isoform X2 [Asparagus officinalis]|uniref:clathrin interactor EPSIN 1-like isoform X1 n=1 Tax=Asparagus officinalis TaxID=4686 RepID=UPI00098E4262|nr:clathrin interactor EPSIN 1-like isoform X1 [Asparagus officinalis]XP_020261850.1 clathrin interactor EPSIN 1-like isoform X2 [Asparagus officinalis]